MSSERTIDRGARTRQVWTARAIEPVGVVELNSRWVNARDLITSVGRGDPVVVVDDRDAGGYGILILAAGAATVENLGIMQRHGSGIVCVTLLERRLEQLDLPMMVLGHNDGGRPAFTVSVDAVAGTTTGISAADRAKTIQTLIHPSTRPEDLARPGHIFPVRYEGGGADARNDLRDVALDLAMKADSYPSGVSTVVLNDHGHTADVNEIMEVAEKWDLSVGILTDILAHLQETARVSCS